MSDRNWTVFRIGLTGGIATGKSAVASMFGDLGVPVIDSDQIAREVVQPGQPALGDIVAAFGPEALDARGELDRERLRAIVFADDELRQQLETILHPRIRAVMLEATHRIGGPYQLLVVPLLVEVGFQSQVDRVLVVDCPAKIQRERLAARDGETDDRGELIIRAQTDRKVRLAAAADIISNAGSLAATRQQVETLHNTYINLAASV
ncbi:MAG: dephospho-CoA kinase [Pseudomonadota bacterium]|jgi:dephospho-CoA kinase|nr:dephospho-CoA kinase [Pseudomonadota bacterium]